MNVDCLYSAINVFSKESSENIYTPLEKYSRLCLEQRPSLLMIIWGKNLSHKSSFMEIFKVILETIRSRWLPFHLIYVLFLRGIKEWYFCSELFPHSYYSGCAEMPLSVSLDTKTTVYGICMQCAWTVTPGGICCLKKRQTWQKNQLWWRVHTENIASSSLSGLPESFTAAPGGSEQFVPKQPAPPRLLILSQ